MRKIQITLKRINRAIGQFYARIKKFCIDYGIILISLVILFVLIICAGVYSDNANKIIQVPVDAALVIAGITIFIFIICGVISSLYRKLSSNHNPYVKDFFINTFHHFGLWIIPLLGIFGYVLSYGGFYTGDKREIICKISDVLVIGGVVGFLTNSFQAFGIFKKELEKVVHSNEYLAGRKNISKIWREVSAIMFERKFRTISEDLFSIIEGQYICKDEYSYYDNYRIITELSWADDECKFVVVKDIIQFDLVTEKRGKIDLSFSAWFSGIKELEKDKDYYHKFSCMIDGKPADIQLSQSNNDADDENIYINRCVVTIDNSNSKDKYEVFINRERKYLFSEDYDISFRARYIVKDMRLSLFLPDNIKARFICRGTPSDFKVVKNDQTYKEFSYKGLILQRQGYTFALHKI